MVSPWADDVSGNKSKQYNKHMNRYTGNGCLPGRLLQQEFHVHYVSSSPHASSAEKFPTFLFHRDHAKSTETKPVKAYNAATKRKYRFILRVPGLPADNPQQSEEASHMGSRANFPCRKCHWGGTNKEKETNQMYHEFQLAGALRNTKDPREPPEAAAISNAWGSEGNREIYWIELLVRKFQELKAECPRCTVDQIASEATPLELLHTILLGVIKYIWHHMNTEQWADTDRHLLAIRLQSTDISGLTYKNNLLGKHFKTVMQTLLFHIHEISTPEQFQLVKAAGELGARLWVPETDDMREYLAQLRKHVIEPETLINYLQSF
ncbi:hypothetical protein DFH07DRAFT_866822 [Mycena maculata]|uniref:Uncharacterized protein n=1 Tax=Mycena maculata TaxID=230809 RepID=A0AAD7NNE1_9AGAR|nr:hypothetical protein DFH07DRAFT_866822 [Mycena maculata]